MAGRLPHDKLSFAIRVTGLTGLLGLCPLGLPRAEAATDPRIVGRYRQMVDANPVEGAALDRLWKIAQEDGFASKLVDEYRDRAGRGDVSAQLIWGHLLHRAGREDQSLEAFRHAADMDPASPLPHLALARALPAGEAGPELEKGVALLPPGSPELPALLQQLGDAWLAAGEPEKAAQAWEKRVKLDPGNLELRQRLATLYQGKGMAAQAATHYAYLDEHGDSATRADALRALARLHQANGDADSAWDTLEKAISLTAPDHWLRGELVSEMVRIGQQANRVAELEARWKKAAAANPRSVSPPLELTELYEREGRLKEERGALETAATLAPGDFGVKSRLARLLVRLDDLPAAAAQFDAALALRPSDSTLVFERAELDIRQGNADAARQRVEAAEAAALRAGDPSLTPRVLAFFTRYRMFAALEARLRKPDADPTALADFLFNQHRPKEAREALQRLVKPTDPPAAQAEARQRIADLLKTAGELPAAVEEMRAAVALAPGSRPLQLALGDFLLAVGGPEARASAREAFSRALSLSATETERVEADQRLFKTFDGDSGVSAEAPATAPALITAASRAVATLFSAPGASPSPAETESPGLQKFIEGLEKKARDSHESAAWLRLARWQLWNRAMEPAAAAANEAVALAPKEAAPHELAVSIAMAAGNKTAALTQLHQLVQIAPERKTEWLKQTAQIELQLGQFEEALQILGDFAKDGDPAALTDLANGQQLADRWYDALATWERLYNSPRKGHRYDVLQPLVRVMQRLEMKQRVSDLLWSAFEEQTDETARSSILHDLIAQAQERGAMPWLLEKLQLRAGGSGSPSDLQALAAALKADGQMEEAFKNLKLAALSAPDRPAAEETLVREAEALLDFPQALEHQHLRLKLLPSPAAADWQRLAALEESALDYPAADATRAEIVRRFPRDSEALLDCANYFERWGQPERARQILRSVRRFDPANLPAAAGLVRLFPGSAGTAGDRKEAREAAEALLARPTEAGAGTAAVSLVLPPVPASMTVRLQAYLSTFGSADGGVSVFDDRTPASTERDWRLEAIRFLARDLDEPGHAAWLARWQNAPSLSEKLWALYYAGARKEAFAHLLAFAEKTPGEPGGRAATARHCALVWCALCLGDWEELGDWLWVRERTPEDYEAFQVALGDWCALGLPLDGNALFAKAPLSQVWPCAEVLANHHRLGEATLIASRAFQEMPSPRGAAGLSLANWRLGNGDLEGAKAVLGAIATEPGDSLDGPTYAAQRALFLLLPEPERAAWVRQMLEGLAVKQGTSLPSPVHAALTTALLQTLSGNIAASHEALKELVALRAGPIRDEPSVERVWSFLLAAGVQFQLWNLGDAATFLWEHALEDKAAIQLQGARAMAFAAEIRVRLAAARLLGANAAQAPHRLEEIAKGMTLASLNQLASLLETSGFRAEAARVLDHLHRDGAKIPLIRLLAACKAVGDTATGNAAIARWSAHPSQDLASAPAAVEFTAARDPARALTLVQSLVSQSPDPRLLELQAVYQRALGHWDEAEKTWRRLVTSQPSNAAFRIAWADLLAAQGHRDTALALLKEAPRRASDLEAKKIELLLEAKAFAQARRLAAGLIRDDNPALVERVAKAFAAHGRKEEGLRLLLAASEAANQIHKPQAAFKIQRQFVELAGPGADPVLRARGLRRLHRLAAGRPELTSAYFELTADSRWQTPQERRNELLEAWGDGRGSTVAGAWLAAALLDAGQADGAKEVLTALLARADLQEPLLTWLDDLAKRANRPDLSLAITEILLKRSPDETSHALRRARTLHALGREEEAGAVLEKAALRWVFVPNLAGRVGLVAQEIGNAPLARDLLGKAVAADPAARQSEVYLGYARLLTGDRDFSGAKRILRQAFRNPANTRARAIVEYLRASGRPAATELRDLEVRPEIAAEVERLLGS